jgi:hypothetical protein
VQWWSVLNARRTPRDLPPGFSPDAVFTALTEYLSQEERLNFWNGDFRRGLKTSDFL